MSRPPRSDSEALRRLRSDPDAICVLYDRHVARLVTCLAQRCGDKDLAFDLAQETFARALEHGHRVRLPPDGSAWPWLWTVARNLLADWHRRGVADSSSRARLGIASTPYDADSVDDLIARLDAAALTKPLADALTSLPPAQRRAVNGRVSDDLSYGELAAACGTTEQAIRARVSRGLRAMRLRLSEVKS